MGVGSQEITCICTCNGENCFRGIKPWVKRFEQDAQPLGYSYIRSPYDQDNCDSNLRLRGRTTILRALCPRYLTRSVHRLSQGGYLLLRSLCNILFRTFVQTKICWTLMYVILNGYFDRHLVLQCIKVDTIVNPLVFQQWWSISLSTKILKWRLPMHSKSLSY